MPQTVREQLKVVAERCVLVHVVLPREYVDERDVFGEIRALAETAGAVVVGELLQRRQKPSGRTYLGKGKIEELLGLVGMTGATVVIFDNDLSPAQVRSLEEAVSCKIIDRSELILDIFANRAVTNAARLQVEIAQLEYTYPRLRAMWDHLGQVVGGAPVGIGTRGPGEQQLEIDRRLVERRLQALRRELTTIQGRKSREVGQRTLEQFTIGLVGYTNAGKSTVFNRLTAGGAFAHPKLFATLSSRVERWELGGGNAAMLSDTVGFIRNLPHHLVASFRSTLEETIFAHLLLIVLDISDHNAPMQLEVVNRTLNEIGADSQPRILLLNKIDRLENSNDLLVWLNRCPDALSVSAATGQGFEELRSCALDHLRGEIREVRVQLPLRDSKSIAFLEDRTEIVNRAYDASFATLTTRIGRRQVDQLLSRASAMTINDLEPREAIETIWGASNGFRREADRLPPHVRLHPAPLTPESSGDAD